METIIVGELRPYILECSVIPHEQRGFVHGKYVLTNLLTCLYDYTKQIDCGAPMDVIYLDFARSFAKLPLRCLLLKLGKIGLRLTYIIDHFMLE